MKILLVTPKFPESLWGLDTILPVAGKGYVTPTLALPTVAALTPPGHEVVLVDENVEEIDFELPCDLVGISLMQVQAPRGFEIARAFRERGRTVVMGGSFPTLTPGLCRPHADVIFIGEAERTWPRFVGDFERGRWVDAYEEKERIDLATTPLPRFDLLKMDRYFVQSVQFGRGCPYECEFCDIVVMLGRRPRTKTVPQVLAELEEIYRLGGRWVLFADDNFIADRAKAKEMLAAVRDWNASKGYPMLFNTEASLNVAEDDELLRLFHDARFARLFIGIESPRRASLEETGKHMNLRAPLLEQIHRIQSYGIQITAGMIVGFDSDDAAVFEEHRRFIQASRIPQVLTGLLQAPPRTPLWERLEREGRLRDGFTGDSVVWTNVVPKRMSREELLLGQADLLESVFAYDSYAERTIAYLTAPRRMEPIQPRRRSWNEVRMIVRFLLYCLFGGDAERMRFARRILRATLREKPGRLPEALYLTVVHRHFHEYAAKCVATIWKTVARGIDDGAPRATAATLEDEAARPAAG
ncbi:MAG: B12-binding domain-containing radical SAM protein [Deltaproteobacteria bacterium]